MSQSSSSFSSIFVDFEAFQHGKKEDGEDFHLKELCFVAKDRPFEPLHMVFKCTTPWSSLSPSRRRTYRYQTNFLHHLDYYEGTREYCPRCVLNDIREWLLSIGATTNTTTVASAAAINHVEFFVLGKSKLEYLSSQFPQLNWKLYTFANSYAELDNMTHKNLISCVYRDHATHHCACIKAFRLYIDFMKRCDSLLPLH